jgi:hypothetical protein
MNILRWILAYPSAVAVWLFFPMLFLPFVPQDWASPGTDGPIGFLELVFFLSPVASFVTFILILPYSTRLCLTAGIVAFSILSVIGSLLVAFVFLFGASLSAVVWTLVSHICGTVAGTLLSFALIPARSLDR